MFKSNLNRAEVEKYVDKFYKLIERNVIKSNNKRSALSYWAYGSSFNKFKKIIDQYEEKSKNVSQLPTPKNVTDTGARVVRTGMGKMILKDTRFITIGVSQKNTWNSFTKIPDDNASDNDNICYVYVNAKKFNRIWIFKYLILNGTDKLQLVSHGVSDVGHRTDNPNSRITFERSTGISVEDVERMVQNRADTILKFARKGIC